MTKTNSPSDIITLETAQTRVQKWNNHILQNTELLNVKALNIKKEDLLGILAEDGVESVRAYLGIDDQGQVDLMFVGVNKEGKDMCGSDLAGNIYDLTEPCPNICDTESPLFITE